MNESWDDGAFRFRVTVTLTSELVSRISIESGSYVLYYLRYEFQIGVWMHLGMAE